MAHDIRKEVNEKLMNETEVMNFLRGFGLENPEYSEIRGSEILWVAREDVRPILRPSLGYNPNLVYIPKIVTVQLAPKSDYAYGDPTHLIMTTQSIDYFAISKEGEIHKAPPKENLPKFPKYFVRLENLFVPDEDFMDLLQS